MPEHLPGKFTTTAAPTTNTAIAPGACKLVANEPKDSDNEIGGDDGCASCYSSSMRDLLSDELPEDCTFNGTDELQVNEHSSETILHTATKILFFFQIPFSQHQQVIQELQENLEQMTRDKMTLEAKIIEMSSYKNEMIMLQNEITKLQVNRIKPE